MITRQPHDPERAMKIKAIETSYAGCRFRSRLEARWAVFFDRMGIGWEYEQQGYIIGGTSWSVPEFPATPYLPDFWLPQERLWVEVKGAEADIDYRLMLHAAIPHWGLPREERPWDLPHLLILGPIPRPGARSAHSALDFHKGDVSRTWIEFGIAGAMPASLPGAWFGSDSGSLEIPSPGLTFAAHLPGAPDQTTSAAFTAARSARFEHGQHGA